MTKKLKIFIQSSKQQVQKITGFYRYWGGWPPKVSETPAFALALRVFFPRATKRLSSNPRRGEKDGESRLKEGEEGHIT